MNDQNPVEMNLERKDIVASGNPPPIVTFAPESEQKLTSVVDDSLKAKMKYRLICASKCKKFALEFAKANRAQKFTRVGEDFLISCEMALKQHIQSRIKAHPSKGKTLM